MIRKFYSLAHRLTRVPELLAAQDHVCEGGMAMSSADEAKAQPTEEAVEM